MILSLKEPSLSPATLLPSFLTLGRKADLTKPDSPSVQWDATHPHRVAREIKRNNAFKALSIVPGS